MKRLPRLSLVLGLSASLAVGGAVYAQLEGADRGVPPVDSASTFEVTNVSVDVSADGAEKARQEGWRQAQAKAWRALWANTHKRPQSEAPNLPESTLNGMVSGIIIEAEQIGPKRYIATLGVLFDRARTGQLLGISGSIQRSAPMLVIPVLVTGSSFQSFESRNEWQKAWARFRTGNSPVDYVRPTGSGIDPLLLNQMQTRRPGRGWWRLLLDQYGAADVIVPEVYLHRLYPGGPAVAHFVARTGPDNRIVGRVTLRATGGASIARLLDEGVRRLDQIYTEALAGGLLQPDPSLIVPEPPPIEEFEFEAPPERERESSETTPSDAPPTPASTATSFSLQIETPDAAAVNRAELSVSRISGVTSALTTSLALGGTSVMRVTFNGDAAAFQQALEAQGWSVSGSGSTLRISRGSGG